MDHNSKKEMKIGSIQNCEKKGERLSQKKSQPTSIWYYRHVSLKGIEILDPLMYISSRGAILQEGYFANGMTVC